MSVKEKALAFCKRFGRLSGLGAAKSGAKMALSALLPGGSVVVELIELVLDCVHETAKDQLIFEDRPLPASAEDLRRVEEMLGTLTDDLAPLMERVVRLENRQEEVDQLLAEAIETLDEHGRNAFHQIDHLARRFDVLEKQIKKMLQNQIAPGLLAELLPLMRRMAGIADYIDDLCQAGVSAADFRTCLHQFQDAARAFGEGHIAEAATRFQKAAQSQPLSAAAATALAGAKAAGQDFPAAEQSIASAARLRPDDAELTELHRRMTVASRGATPREQSSLRGGPRQPPKIGDTLDGWRLDLLLGRGGWGYVFKASCGSEVRALKVMHPDLSFDPRFVERFRREIGALYGLRGQRYLAQIHDFGKSDDFACWYYVMEFIEGTSLERYLQKRGALTLDQARPLFLALADGLAAAHARGIIHRDIKPANILLRRPNGEPVLVDFGLAAVTDDRALTQTGRSAGYTAMFAAPEQLHAGATDVRSDIYSLAASLYYALVYDKPEDRPPYRFEADHIPEALRELLTNALHRKAERRPQTIQSFREALQDAVDNLKRERIRLLQRTEQAAERLASLDIELDELNATESELQARMSSARQALIDLRQERDRLRQVRDETTQRAAALREQRSGLYGRIEVLEGLERSHEGLGTGPRELFALLKQPDPGPWRTVLGILAEFLTVRREFAPLIDLALGATAQRFLVRDPDQLAQTLQ